MDPDATVRDILEAVAAGRTGDAVDGMGYLCGWLDRGGFPPILGGIRTVPLARAFLKMVSGWIAWDRR